MIAHILASFFPNPEQFTAVPFGTGLINRTWKISSPDKVYILQKINHNIFRHPSDIAYNISAIANYLQVNAPGYQFVAPVKNLSGEELTFVADDGYYRLFPFVAGSHTIDIVTTPGEAFEAAKQFALFTKILSGFDAMQLKCTLPDFHNLGFRYKQFTDALAHGNEMRREEAAAAITYLQSQKNLADIYDSLLSDNDFKQRVTHHDTKISNVLFNDQNKALCVIDLDTVMPGYFISDVGDMMRTYLSDASEEETDFDKINVRDEFFKAIVAGYMSEMRDALTDIEKQYFFYAGQFIIYMQALRFITDYLNNDVYYTPKYEKHNYNRGLNQIRLLQELNKKEPVYKDLISSL